MRALPAADLLPPGLFWLLQVHRAMERKSWSRSGDLFDHLARRYDRGNRIMSLGQDLRWKRRAAARLANHLRLGGNKGGDPGFVLDLGAGTGDLGRLLGLEGIRAVSVDASPQMLGHGAPEPVVADAARLPLAPESAAGAISGFLLRNLPDLDAFFASVHAALAPGAPLVILEVSIPRGVRRLGFGLWFHILGPLAAGAATGQWRAYRYLSRSLRGFPRPPELAARAKAAGWGCVFLEVSPWTGVFLMELHRDGLPVHPV